MLKLAQARHSESGMSVTFAINLGRKAIISAILSNMAIQCLLPAFAIAAKHPKMSTRRLSSPVDENNQVSPFQGCRRSRQTKSLSSTQRCQGKNTCRSGCMNPTYLPPKHRRDSLTILHLVNPIRRSRPGSILMTAGPLQPPHKYQSNRLYQPLHLDHFFTDMSRHLVM